MVMTERETHVHRRPGGAVYDAACRCADPNAWPPEEGTSLESLAPADAEGVQRTPAIKRPRRLITTAVARRIVARLAAIAVAIAGRSKQGATRLATASGAGALGVLRLVGALIRGLGNGAQIAGVGVATWAVWEIEPTAGKLVLAAGLLFLGGAIARVAMEVRNGTH